MKKLYSLFALIALLFTASGCEDDYRSMVLFEGVEPIYQIGTCDPLHSHSVDYFFEIVDYPRFFQWNIMNHSILQKTCMDIDGVLCADPTPEENDDGEKYRHFLLNARNRAVSIAARYWSVYCGWPGCPRRPIRRISIFSAFSDLKSVFFQGVTFPFCERMDNFCIFIVLLLNTESNRAFITV